MTGRKNRHTSQLGLSHSFLYSPGQVAGYQIPPNLSPFAHSYIEPDVTAAFPTPTMPNDLGLADVKTERPILSWTVTSFELELKVPALPTPINVWIAFAHKVLHSPHVQAFGAAQAITQPFP